MTKNDRWLDGISIATPCPAEWAGMQGDDRCRFCSQCKLHVFDLSAMTRPEAEALVRERTGSDTRLCLRFRRRADGTILTQDCPVGIRQRVRRAAARIVAACGALLAFAGCRKPETQPAMMGIMMGEVASPNEQPNPRPDGIAPPQLPEVAPK